MPATDTCSLRDGRVFQAPAGRLTFRLPRESRGLSFDGADMRTVLHIGMPKTGSTALQNCLRASRESLAAAGVLYPDNPPGCGFNNHRLLVFGYTPFGRLPRHVRRHAEYTRQNHRETYREFLGHVAGQVAERQPEVMVLSSETLFRRPTLRVRRALRAALLPQAERVDVAVYLRRPSDYYLSNLQQRLRNSWDVGPLWVPPMAAILRGYAAAFGAEAVKPRLFERGALRDGDVVADFLAAWLPDQGIDVEGLSRGKNDNPSVSGESMDILRRYRRAFHRRNDNVIAPDSVELVRVLRRLEGRLGAGRPVLREGIAGRLDCARSDPLEIRDRWGITFSGLDYRSLERRGPLLPSWVERLPGRRRELSELIVIDPQMQAALLAALRRTKWARAEPARRAWIAGMLRGSGA